MNVDRLRGSGRVRLEAQELPGLSILEAVLCCLAGGQQGSHEGGVRRNLDAYLLS